MTSLAMWAQALAVEILAEQLRSQREGKATFRLSSLLRERVGQRLHQEQACDNGLERWSNEQD